MNVEALEDDLYRCGGERTGAGQTTEDHILVVDIDVIQGGFNL